MYLRFGQHPECRHQRIGFHGMGVGDPAAETGDVVAQHAGREQAAAPDMGEVGPEQAVGGRAPDGVAGAAAAGLEDLRAVAADLEALK